MNIPFYDLAESSFFNRHITHIECLEYSHFNAATFFIQGFLYRMTQHLFNILLSELFRDVDIFNMQNGSPKVRCELVDVDVDIQTP